MALKCIALARLRDVAPPNPNGYRENKSTMCLEGEEPRIFDKHNTRSISSHRWVLGISMLISLAEGIIVP